MLHSPKSVLFGNLWTSRGLVRGCALTCLRSGHSHEDVDQLFGSLSTFLFRRGQKAEVPEDFRVLIATFLGELHRPFEKGRYSLRLEQTRPWMLSCVTATFFLFSFKYRFRSSRILLGLCAFRPARKGFLEAGLPVFVKGMGGPGAAHEFRFERREMLSFLML